VHPRILTSIPTHREEGKMEDKNRLEGKKKRNKEGEIFSYFSSTINYGILNLQGM
jgi:hypothetical protein